MPIFLKNILNYYEAEAFLYSLIDHHEPQRSAVIYYIHGTSYHVSTSTTIRKIIDRNFLPPKRQGCVF